MYYSLLFNLIMLRTLLIINYYFFKVIVTWSVSAVACRVWQGGKITRRKTFILEKPFSHYVLKYITIKLGTLSDKSAEGRKKPLLEVLRVSTVISTLCC